MSMFLWPHLDCIQWGTIKRNTWAFSGSLASLSLSFSLEDIKNMPKNIPKIYKKYSNISKIYLRYPRPNGHRPGPGAAPGLGRACARPGRLPLGILYLSCISGIYPGYIYIYICIWVLFEYIFGIFSYASGTIFWYICVQLFHLKVRNI